jgi:hypothetical protein
VSLSDRLRTDGRKNWVPTGRLEKSHASLECLGPGQPSKFILKSLLSRLRFSGAECSKMLVFLSKRLCLLWSIKFLHVFVIINHRYVQVVGWQVLPPTNKRIVLSRAGVMGVLITLVFTCNEGGEQAAHWIHHELTRGNLDAKAVGYALEFSLLDQWFVFWAHLLTLFTSKWIHSNCNQSSQALSCHEARISGSVWGAAVCGSICNRHLRGWKRAELHSKRYWIRLTLGPSKVSRIQALTWELVLGASSDVLCSECLSEKHRSSRRLQRMQKVM